MEDERLVEMLKAKTKWIEQLLRAGEYLREEVIYTQEIPEWIDKAIYPERYEKITQSLQHFAFTGLFLNLQC